MKHIYGIEKTNNTCVTFGRFDGVHKGHIAVVDSMIQESKKHGVKSLLLSFDCSKEAGDFLTTEEEKEHLFKKTDLNILMSVDYADVKNISPELFVRNILIGQLGAKIIVIGKDYCFGKDGNIELLHKIAYEKNVQVIVENLVKEDGVIVCSQDIKEILKAGSPEKVIRLCNHPYTMIGEIVHGKALGRTVGMPTANLNVVNNKLMPLSGVYGTLTNIDGKIYQGLTNIGKRPSVDDSKLITIETFLLDFSKNIYGKNVILETHSYIRGVVKFNNLDEVKKQVEKDIIQIRSYFDTIGK